MTEHEYAPDLDMALLADWCEFCEGTRAFDKSHFATILMGVFSAGLTPEVDDFLKRFTSTFPRELYDNLVRICEDPCPDRDLLPWIRRDLAQELMILLEEDYPTEHANIQRLVEDGKFIFVDDRLSFVDLAMASANFNAIYFAEGDYVSDHLGNDPKMFALKEALYHIATNYFLAHSIMSPLVHGKIDLSNYFEIYLRGGEYVVGDDTIFVWQYKPDA